MINLSKKTSFRLFPYRKPNARNPIGKHKLLYYSYYLRQKFAFRHTNHYNAYTSRSVSFIHRILIMSASTLVIGNISWIHLVNPSEQEITKLAAQHDLHELVAEDLMELNTQDKIDVYDDHIALVIHFPKLGPGSTGYLLNEFNIVLGKDYIISVTRFHTNHIENLRKEFINEMHQYQKDDEHFKITPYFMLYEIINTMYDKLNRILAKNAKDSLVIEEQIFNHIYDSQVISNLLIKRRNLSFIKHNFVSQKEVIEELSNTLPSFYEEELEVYFDDLISKQQKLTHVIEDQQANINSLAETYNSLMSIRMNDTILLLTVVTIILGTMTLVAGIYGMNVRLPFDQHPYAFVGIIGFLAVFARLQFIVLSKLIIKKPKRKPNQSAYP